MNRQQRKTGTLASSDKIDLRNLNYASMHYKFNSVLPLPGPTLGASPFQAISGIANLALISPYPSTVDRACRFPLATCPTSPL